MVDLRHVSGATEGHDFTNDGGVLKSPNYPRVNFYSRANDCMSSA
jgi:hypothetical protein